MNIKTAVFSVITLVSMSSIADEFHYNNMLIGDRASGLGGAYTAISDDAAGLYYNPAGIVFSGESKLTASVNAFHTSKTTYEGVLNGGDWVRESSALVPNFFGMTRKMGDFYVGFSYAVTDSVIENQDSRFTTVSGIPEFIVNVSNRDITNLIGPSLAMQISDTLNIGITLYLHKRERKLINNQWVKKSNDTYEWSNLNYDISEAGFQTVLGLLWSPSDDLSLGLSIRDTNISSSSVRTQSTCVSDINSGVPQCTANAGVPNDPSIYTGDQKRDLPRSITLGVAYFPTDKLLFDIDISFYEATSDDFADREATINIAAGIEYYLSQKWVIRSGFYTNKSNTKNIVVGGIDQEDHVDQTGVSLSLTHFSKDSSFTAGFTSMTGSGEAQVISGSTAIQNVEQTSLTLFISNTSQF